MNTRVVPALIAACVTLSVGITPAASYFRQEGAQTIQRPSLRTSGSLNSMSSSSSRTSTLSSASSVSSRAIKTPTNDKERASCMQKAAMKREAAIAKSLDEFYAVMHRMLELRSGLIVKNWGLTDTKKRDTNIRMVWRSFGSAWKNHGRTMKDLRRDAWDKFRVERSLCGVYDGSDPDAGGLSADSQF